MRRDDVDTVTTPLCLEPSSPSWPRELDTIERGPERVWVRGRLDRLEVRPRVAIVGTRSPSPYGDAQARRFARELVRAGVCIVSGLARGIDQAAHEAALEAGGATIAVLGSGVDRPWPPGPACEAVSKHGLLLSEFHPGEAPRPHHFPLRNRVISGLSCGVLVVEAAFASGSLITARWATDQGRHVWALPGRVDQPMARGAHRLLREGAGLVESPDEILAELEAAGEPVRRAAPERHDEASAAARGTSDTADADTSGAMGLGGALGGTARRVRQALTGQTLGVDEISTQTGLDPRDVLVALVELEIADVVARAPGGYYRLVT